MSFDTYKHHMHELKQNLRDIIPSIRLETFRMKLKKLRSTMALRFDPRGELPPLIIQPPVLPRSRSSLFTIESRNTTTKLSSLSLGSKPRVRLCHDWIFSSCSNVHVALDRSTFKEYTPFDSYVLTMSDHQQVQVRGIGTVELKIRRKPGSRESHTIVLHNVLHVPFWLCNLFSDTYFQPGHDFEHTWTNTGVQFVKRETAGFRAWGYTESFCSLDRLVLSKHHKDGRSPMLEDKEREVFSVNITWPKSQQDRWNEHLAGADCYRGLEESVSHRGALMQDLSNLNTEAQTSATVCKTLSRRITMGDINANIVMQAPSKRTRGLGTNLSCEELSKDIA